MINRVLDKSKRIKVVLPEEEKDKFPEPVFDSYTLEVYDTYGHFLKIMNYHDYDEDLAYKVDNISHPEFDSRAFKESGVSIKYPVNDWRELGSTHYGYNGVNIYVMHDGKSPHMTYPETTLEKGTPIELRITLKKDGIEKVYNYTFDL